MSMETRKVLDMLAAGKITPEEAEKLLGRLSAGAAGGRAAEPQEEAQALAAGRKAACPPRYLRIVVDSAEREDVNIRLPIGLIRTGLQLSTMIPGSVGKRLSERGIDLAHLGGLDDEELIAELAALQVEIGGGDGETIRIFCE